MPVRIDRMRLRATRWWRWLRRVLAVGLLAAAALLSTAGPARVAPVEPTAGVLTASRDLPPGHVLAAADVQVDEWPSHLLPADALDPADDPTGRVLAAAVRTGEPISRVRLVGPGLAQALGPGFRAVPVRLTDVGVSQLLLPGDRIDLYAVDTGVDTSAFTAGDGSAAPAGTLVAADLLVVGLSRAVEGPVTEGAIVVLAVPVDTVAVLVGAAYSRSLAATLAPP